MTALAECFADTPAGTGVREAFALAGRIGDSARSPVLEPEDVWQAAERRPELVS